MRGQAGSSPSRDRLAGALGALVRGFDRADQAAGGSVLGPRTPEGLATVLTGLTVALLRSLVLARAGEQGLLHDEGERTPYEVHADLGRRRQGSGGSPPDAAGRAAWAALTAAFRAVHATRGGGLFDPERFPFLERGDPGDEAVWEALDGLLGGEDAPDGDEVESLGAVYEALLGLSLGEAAGDSLVLLPAHTAVDLEALVAVPGPERGARLEALAGITVRGRLAADLAGAGSVEALRTALARKVSPLWPDLARRGSLFLSAGEARRRAGAHYTPRAITALVVERALAPLLDRAEPLDLRVCDPAMGSGAFLVEACRWLGSHVAVTGVEGARRKVAERCLHGVDRDPVAVELARVSLWLLAGDRHLPMTFVDHALRAGDALLGEGPEGGPSHAEVEALCDVPGRAPLHWPRAFPEVLGPRGGFDAILGNPPWVAYAGRAAHPLPDDLFEHYRRHYPTFAGYRTLHGLFVYRSASILRPAGRMGLVVPTSISDLAGYAPTRRAHDALCQVDDELPDLGDAFTGVFQPAMALLSTRRATAPRRDAADVLWRVAREDLDPASRALLARLSALPPLPAACFGERGYQTTGEDTAKIAPSASPAPPFVVPIREGTDVRSFQILPPRLHLDPDGLRGRLRPPAEWGEVAVLIRQTARYPIAALADGAAFRNSVLAGFAAQGLDRFTLCAWLNAAPIRWLHYMRYRDARQGMPQVKISHLRSVPRVPDEHLAALRGLGEELGTRNRGASAAEQRALDEAAGRALDLSPAEHRLIAAWAEANPAP